MIIYKTTNILNGKIYIGSDKNNNPNYLGSGLILKQAIKKYGKENFKKETIEECESLSSLKEREGYWIKFFKSNKRDIGYNISDGYFGGNVFENHPNKEQYRERLREPSLGKNNPMYKKSVYSVWVEKYGEEEAKKRLKKQKEKISMSLKKRFKEIKQRNLYDIWIDKHGEEEAKKRLKILSEKRKRNAIYKNSNRKIVGIMVDNEIIKKYDSMKEFCDKENINMNFARKWSNRKIFGVSSYWNGKKIIIIKTKDIRKGGSCEILIPTEKMT